jgi:thioredoxin reductase (NADPH)
MAGKLDLIVVGAGPAGLAAAIEAKRRGFDFLLIEKGCVVNSIYHYPQNMTFFTTGELLEIGNLPMVVRDEKPKRADALKYYRRVAEHYSLPIRDWEAVINVSGQDMDFQVTTRDRFEEENQYKCRKIIFSTGYYDNPNLLNVPGEELDKVSHYYDDPHPYYGKKVAVIGGKNSAAIAALELYRGGADKVILIHRGSELGREVKYWIRPDINNRIERGEVKAYFSTTVKEIRPREIVMLTPGGEVTLPNDYVFALIGYHPDTTLLEKAGIEIEPDTLIPSHNPESLETNVQGIFLAGSIVSGRMTNRVFIENGRFHGEQIMPHIEAALGRVPVGGE